MDEQRGRKLVETAYTWLAEGVSVVPANPKSKRVTIPWGIFQEVKPSGAQVEYWFRAGLANIAAVCGTGGLLVLDFDDQAYYETWRAAAGELANTYTETTGRGYHAFYKVADPVSRRFIGVEALGNGHLCNLAPSIHPGGEVYQAFGDPLAPIKKTDTRTLFSLLSEKPRPSAALAAAELSLSNKKLVSGGDLISKIKTAYPLLDYVTELVQLAYPRVDQALPRPSGRDRFYLARCPLHADHEPSLWVDTKRQIWRCFAASCRGSAGGDVINLWALANNIDVSAAIRQLAKGVK